MRLDEPGVTRQVFHPRPAHLAPSFFVDVDGGRLACYRRGNNPDAVTVLHFHGNGELASEYAQGAWRFLALGVNVCFAEYRGYGLSTGRPALAAMLGDGERIVQALGVSPQRLVVFGRSLGSLYAIELARRLPAMTGVGIESGVADLLDTPLLANLAADPRIVREAQTYFDHRAKLAGYHGRLLVLHAAKDRLLPPAHAERLHAWAGCVDKRLVVFPDGDHNTIFAANADDYLREVGAFLRRAGGDE